MGGGSGGPDRSRFGDRLRQLRVLAGLTQDALAERSGVSVKAIASLENGRRLRPRDSTVALLADGLGLTGPERQQLDVLARGQGHPRGRRPQGDQEPGARPPAPGAGLPPDPVAHFAGRESDLEELAELLGRHDRAAVVGLAGVGKTQLVARHVQLHAASYPDGVFWLRAEDESVLVADLAGLAWRLGLPEREERRQERQIEAVLRRLRRRSRWLIVLDNLEPAAEDAARHWLPPGLPGSILLTSRSPIGGHGLHLHPLSLEAATRFLLARTGQADTAAAVAVSERLGCLPLALEQAGAYVEATGRDLASYAELLETRLLELMREGGSADHPRPVAHTWQLSLHRLADERPAAVALVRLCAFLAPDDVPVSALVAAADAVPDELGRVLADALELDRTVAALRRYSLVERRGDGLAVHRLVQAVVRESLPAEQRERWLAAAIRVLRARFPDRSDHHPERWPHCARLLPHVEAVARLAGDPPVEPEALAWVLDRASTYLQARGELSAARPWKEWCLAIRERALGPDHLDVAHGLSNLAVLLLEQGEVAPALALHERALAIRERVLGPDHRDFVESLNNLGMSHRDRGDLAAARPLLERALAIRERVLPPDHAHLALSLNNLALVLGELGELEAARPLQERALAINERTIGPDHPHTAITLGNLGNLVRDQGDLAAAEGLLLRALEISERVLGPEHPQTANGLDNLALLRWRQGDHGAARALLERGLAIRECQLGPDHLRTARSLQRLGRLLVERGERGAGVALLERAAAAYERALGRGHRTAVESRRELLALQA